MKIGLGNYLLNREILKKSGLTQNNVIASLRATAT